MFVSLPSSRKSAGVSRSMSAVPAGLRVNRWFRPPHPTLKHGADNPCAYGAGGAVAGEGAADFSSPRLVRTACQRAGLCLVSMGKER